MRTEIPKFKRCCCCLPLRYGLLVWSYLLVIPLICYACEYISTCMYFIKHHFRLRWHIIVYYATGIMIFVVTIGLTFLFIVAAHKKNIRMLKIYYKFAFPLTIAASVIDMLWYVYVTVDRCSEGLFYTTCETSILWVLFGFMSFVVKLYVLGLVRSEILKLDENYNNVEFQFCNIAAAAENAYYEPNTSIIVVEKTAEKTETNKSMI